MDHKTSIIKRFKLAKKIRLSTRIDYFDEKHFFGMRVELKFIILFNEVPEN